VLLATQEHWSYFSLQFCKLVADAAGGSLGLVDAVLSLIVISIILFIH